MTENRKYNKYYHNDENEWVNMMTKTKIVHRCGNIYYIFDFWSIIFYDFLFWSYPPVNVCHCEVSAKFQR